MKPYTVLDLYCGGGGAGKGYADAGFNVIGVDIANQMHYPFEFFRWEALNTLKRLIQGYQIGSHSLNGIDAIHASPPCQRYSQMSRCQPGLSDKSPDLVEPTRFLLRRTGLPYVIENVMGAPLMDPTMLCGSHFGLQAEWEGHGEFGVQRHRLFETWPFRAPSPGMCDHSLPAIPAYGHGAGAARKNMRGKGFTDTARRAMEIGWMNRDELSEAIPPAYTRHIGGYLWLYLETNNKRHHDD
jgi:DNA (cytosine-5)-methyltransferase 1